MWPARLVLAMLLAGCSGGSADHAGSAVSEWLERVALAEGDRGWSMLTAFAQSHHFGNDQAAYVEQASDTDWDDFHWTVTGDAHEPDGGAWQVDVRVAGGYDEVPSFLHESGLVSVWCIDRSAVGLIASVVIGPLGDARISGTARTGTAERGECS